MSEQGGGNGWSTDPPAAQPPGAGGPPPPPGWGTQQPPPSWGAPPPPPPPAGYYSGQAQPPQPRPRLRPLTLADVLDGMFRIFLGNWRTFVVALGVILVPLQFVIALLSGLAGMNVGFWEQFMDPASAQATLATGLDVPALIALGVVSFLAAIFVNPFLTGVGCLVAAEAFEGGTPQPRPVLQSSAQKYWAMIGATLLVGLIGLGIVAIPSGLLIAGAASGADGLAGLGGFLFLVAVPLLIWIIIRLYLVYPVIVVERVGPVEAMRRSYRLVRGRWWRTFGTLLLSGIVTGIVAYIASFPFALPGGVFGDAAGIVFTTIGTLVTSLITTPLTSNVLTLLYYDGRIRSEGYDLEVMTRDVLGGDTPPDPGHERPFG